MVAFSVAPGYRRSRPPMRPKLDPFVGIIDRILAQAPYDACEKRAARVNSLSLVRYRGNDYSVPTAYGHREVLMRAMSTRWLSPARQMRSRVIRDPTEREDFVFNPLNTWRCWNGPKWRRPDAIDGLRLFGIERPEVRFFERSKSLVRIRPDEPN
jgi:hypothetical protein